MTVKRLCLATAPEPVTMNDFVWRRTGDGQSSFRVNIDPGLADLGNVQTINRDMVWLATTIFLADRTTIRNKGWGRDLRVSVPTSNADLWNCVRDEVEEMLCFLTSDEWHVTFTAGNLDFAPPDRQNEFLESNAPELVCLFSGGADSVCGAVQAILEGRRVALLSHWDWTGHSGTQSELAKHLERILGIELPHLQVNLGRSAKQINGVAFRNEPSRRSRGLLFMALGLGMASARGNIPLLIAENGFTSLNPSLAPERRGALTTRTTHPMFLKRLQTIMRATNSHADFMNPFKSSTKGEMFKALANEIGRGDASELLSKSHSCSHVQWGGRYGRSPGTQCGVCLGCVVRRAAFIESDLDDQTTYLLTDLADPELSKFVESLARPEIEAIRYAVNREIGPADIIALNLPDDYDAEDAFSLLNRGFQEIAAVGLP